MKRSARDPFAPIGPSLRPPSVPQPSVAPLPQPSVPPLPPLLAVVGATASGKSPLALALAEDCAGEIVNLDSLQVYRRLDIGTAKPGAAERARVPHHVLDVVQPDEPYSAGRYVADARAAIADIVGRGRVPILCGGTGLYYRALLFGLADVPAVPQAVQATVEARIAVEGLGAAHRRLAEVDPRSAAGVHPNDPLRIARALAVHEATGRTLSAWRRERPQGVHPGRVLTLGVQWERSVLYERVNRRVREMLARGWIEEVAGLLAQGYGPELKPLRSIGYREIGAYLQGGTSGAGERESLAARIAQRTRQYAKRQLTWFRRHPEVLWVPPGDDGAARAAARKFLLATRGPR